MSHDAYERYLDDFGRSLERAADEQRRRARRRQRRWLRLMAGGGATVATAAAITLGAMVLPGDSAHRLQPIVRADAISEARAALDAPGGEMLHTLIRIDVALPPDHSPEVGISVPPMLVEQWTATRPSRWRMIQSFLDRKGRVLTLDDYDAHGQRWWTTELAYADGAQSSYTRDRNVLKIVSGLSPHGSASRPPSLAFGGRDPVDALRDLLAHGNLHDRGMASVDGRRVRRLVGTFRARQDRRNFTAIEYDVDPHTFAPVVARLRERVPHFGSGVKDKPVMVLRFLRFEHLPLTPRTAGLLRVHPHPGVRTIRMTVDEVRAQGRARRAAEDRAGRARYRKTLAERAARKRAR